MAFYGRGLVWYGIGRDMVWHGIGVWYGRDMVWHGLVGEMV